MKKLVSFLTFAFIFFIASNLFAQNTYQDIVYLKNGSVVKGIIIEQTPSINLKLKTNDGNVFIYEIKDVEKITKEYVDVIKRDISLNKNKFIQTKAKTYRNPSLSVCLSFLVPGAGQLYNGQIDKGLGIMLWWAGSNVFAVYSYLCASGQNQDALLIISLASSASSIISWIVGVIDAPISANKINKQYGFASIRLNNNLNLSFNPDFKIVNNYSSINSNSVTPTYGLNVRLSF